jgi:hypothetical protein
LPPPPPEEEEELNEGDGDGETLLEANVGPPDPCVATFTASEARDGGGSIGCGGGGGTREAAAAFFQEEGVSEGGADPSEAGFAAEVDFVDFAVLACARDGAGAPRWPRRRAPETRPRSIERICARLAPLLEAGSRIESALFGEAAGALESRIGRAS